MIIMATGALEVHAFTGNLDRIGPEPWRITAANSEKENMAMLQMMSKDTMDASLL